MVVAIKDFNSTKMRIRVGTTEANVMKNDMDYASNVAGLLKQIDSEFKIDSVKNNLTKHISNVSYSLSTYNNTKDSETKEVFKTKLINDIKTLKKKYKVLKTKDSIISATLEKREQM